MTVSGRTMTKTSRQWLQTWDSHAQSCRCQEYFSRASEVGKAEDTLYDWGRNISGGMNYELSCDSLNSSRRKSRRMDQTFVDPEDICGSSRNYFASLIKHHGFVKIAAPGFLPRYQSFKLIQALDTSERRTRINPVRRNG